MIHPLTGLSIAGVIWYQGESNTDNPREYPLLLGTLIRSWRKRWNQGDFPFLVVQLANFGQPDSIESSRWAELREAQHRVACTEPNCGIVCTLDVGHPTDIHPRNKRDVGIRLAYEALRIAYKQKNVPQSPFYRSHQVVDGRVEVTLSPEDVKLISTEPVLGFYLAGEDRVFHPAQARLIGNRVVLTSDKVEKPVSVRYAWQGNPEHNLRTENGLPVFPFRTDDW
ncbi:MAG: hypothetical protein KatS3mg104_3109 [Phycisphaerae bacterium]|nr:MAG: hypothetical protein KatS3mg104_3109 [Phycisphaerae bacterium]